LRVRSTSLSLISHGDKKRQSTVLKKIEPDRSEMCGMDVWDIVR
jgi:hypothetical protein